jgi:hypothetical protein
MSPGFPSATRVAGMLNLWLDHRSLTANALTPEPSQSRDYENRSMTWAERRGPTKPQNWFFFFLQIPYFGLPIICKLAGLSG